MSRRFTLGALTLWLLTAASCLGGFSNKPFSGLGDISGHFVGLVDPSKAWVALEGQLDNQPHIDANGSFVFSQVAVGSQVVLAADGLGRAQRIEIVVLNQRTNELAVNVGPGAWVEGLVHLQGDSEQIKSELGLEGLDLVVETQADGRYRIDGLPQSCFWVWARHENHQPDRARVCTTAGEGNLLNFSLEPREQEDAGSYQDASLTEPDATISDHVVVADHPHDDDVGDENDGANDAAENDHNNQEELDSGSSADANANPDDTLLCHTCTNDQDCDQGHCSAPLESQDGKRICSRPCSHDSECAPGYLCESTDEDGRLCLPREIPCVALLHLGESCNELNPCGSVWDPELCQEGLCTMTCSDQLPCPDGFQCRVGEGAENGFCF